jgi:hypothetical protein
LAGRPKWSFRPPHPNELQELDKKVGELRDQQIDDETKKLLKDNQAALDSCSQPHSNCKLILCDETGWEAYAKGPTGEQGDAGQDGGDGGAAGKPGVLKIYFLKDQPALKNLLATKVRWWQGGSIDHQPPQQLWGEAGEPSVPGLGGIGGQGLPGDPFGVCQAGARGDPEGPPGKKGSEGPVPTQGTAASLTAVSLF